MDLSRTRTWLTSRLARLRLAQLRVAVASTSLATPTRLGFGLLGRKCCMAHTQSPIYSGGRGGAQDTRCTFCYSHVLGNLNTHAHFSQSAVPNLAVRRRSSSSYVWIPAEVLYVQHFRDRGIGADRGLHCPERRATSTSAPARLVVIIVAFYLG